MHIYIYARGSKKVNLEPKFGMWNGVIFPTPHVILKT